MAPTEVGQVPDRPDHGHRSGSHPVTNHPEVHNASPTSFPIRPVPMIAAVGTRSDLEMQGSRQTPDLIHQHSELGRKQGLSAVDQRSVRSMMHVDH
jgi:hypothetical protein